MLHVVEQLRAVPVLKPLNNAQFTTLAYLVKRRTMPAGALLHVQSGKGWPLTASPVTAPSMI